MRRLKLTPRQFGLKVREHPDLLMVTALNKMRTATTITVPISVQGRLLETPRLKTKPETLADNEKAFRLFVAHMDSIGTPGVSSKGPLWEGVPRQLVVDLLRDFDSHPWHLSFQGRALAEFVEAAPGLDEWTVVIPEAEGKPVILDGAQRKIKIMSQTRKVDETDGMIRISGSKVRVGSGGLTQAGLTSERIKQVEDEFRATNGKKHVPDSAYLIKGRKPLLMLHVIQAKQPTDNIPETLFAIGIGLPGTDEEEKTATYAVNLVELRNWIEIDDEDDDDVD